MSDDTRTIALPDDGGETCRVEIETLDATGDFVASVRVGGEVVHRTPPFDDFDDACDAAIHFAARRNPASIRCTIERTGLEGPTGFGFFLRCEDPSLDGRFLGFHAADADAEFADVLRARVIGKSSLVAVRPSNHSTSHPTIGRISCSASASESASPPK